MPQKLILRKEGLKFDPLNPDLYCYLGLARLALGDRMSDPRALASFYGEAIKAFESARALVPQEKLYQLELATALDRMQRFEEAEAIFYDALQWDPKSESLQKYYEGHLNLWRGTPPAAETPHRQRCDSVLLGKRKKTFKLGKKRIAPAFSPR